MLAAMLSVDSHTKSSGIYNFRAGSPFGLRVLVRATPDSEVVSATLAVRVGSRSETSAWSGLAHLAEHVSCGQETAAAQRLSAAGGSCNAVTQPDLTLYHGQVVAEEAPTLLDRLLEILGEPAIDARRIATEVTIVGDEISAAMDSTVMGGFPWLWLPAALYDSQELAHNGYGDLESLRRVDEAALTAFFSRHYRADNAVLAICAADPAPLMAVLGVAEREAAVPVQDHTPGPTPVLTPAAPYALIAPRQPHQATAIAWSLPDQPMSWGHIAATVLADILVGDHGGALEEQIEALEVSAYGGPFGDPWGIAAPLPFVVEIHHSADLDPESWVPSVREVLRSLAHDTDADAVAAAARTLAVRFFAAWDDPAEQSKIMATAELVYGDANHALQIPGLLAAADPAEVRAAAAALAAAPARLLTRGPRS
ncbi:insulinase family protein [Micromonospora sp. 4G57]|uniref:Insulinase family protein n=1 Tax=Micromonospora sicca TaxID=2202420 RepID=A0ABU5JAZ9_9ACTN|nr:MULTISPECIES: insulinase family protein [unclassified Micromonospora]MDZ5444406.1 insulinase family protein [Micromonospora sp. 4G57]MDZ5489760.1 insulinase family protein [Micromonospora sp. 4G53]